MRVPKFKKKFIAGAMAAGLAMGASGIAAAYLTVSGSGTGTVTLTAGSGSVTLSGAHSVQLTSATSLTITVDNTYAHAEHLGYIHVTATTNGHCGGTQTDTLSTKVTFTYSTTAVGTVAHGTSTISSGTDDPKITIATTSSTTQSTCSVSLTFSTTKTTAQS